MEYKAFQAQSGACRAPHELRHSWKAALRASGQLIEDADLLIATIALVHDMTPSLPKRLISATTIAAGGQAVCCSGA
jgi:hypothetical protein